MLMPNTRAMIIASSDSSSVTGSLLAISSVTGSCVRKETPRSPCSARVSQWKYCTGMGASRLSSARSWAITAGSRSSPAMAMSGSPGSSFCSPNTIILTSNSVGMASSRRLQISSSMVSPRDGYFASVTPARRTMPSGYGLKPCTLLFRPKIRGSK